MNLKAERQNRILEIIKNKEIATQQELENELKESGFYVKQATLSRDIRELRLTKVMQYNNKYKYVSTAEQYKTNIQNSKSTLRNMITGIKIISNNVLIRTQKDMAQSLCSLIDNYHIELIEGMVYGIDTVLIICYTNIEAVKVYHKLNEIIS